MRALANIMTSSSAGVGPDGEATKMTNAASLINVLGSIMGMGNSTVGTVFKGVGSILNAGAEARKKNYGGAASSLGGAVQSIIGAGNGSGAQENSDRTNYFKNYYDGNALSQAGAAPTGYTPDSSRSMTGTATNIPIQTDGASGASM